MAGNIKSDLKSPDSKQEPRRGYANRIWDSQGTKRIMTILAANPFGQNAHGLAGGRVELGFTPGAGFGKAQVVENGDQQVDAGGRADQNDAHGFAHFGRLSAGVIR